MSHEGEPRRILVVDDDAAIARLVRKALEADYQVRSTTSAATALTWLSSGEVFDAVVFDLWMPGMSGVRFHSILVSEYPDLALRAVVLTGGAHHPETRSFMDSTELVCVSKPFRLAEIQRAVALALDVGR